eukprot:m.18822 g.18822  ORF g.18822 m.18822 type:complete len:184 (-) comp10857_c0_seq4:162-713(-)
MTKTILAICGSLRAKSCNMGLIRAAAKAIPEGWTMEVADISAFPVYNDDLNTDELRPEAVTTFKQQVLAADAILFAAPENNYTIAAATKNCVDWASKSPNCWNEKPAAIMGCGGGHGSGRGQYHFRQMALYINMHVMVKPEIMLNRFAESAFDDDGNLTSDKWIERVATFVQSLTVWADRLKV